jgi:hypothetical protein
MLADHDTTSRIAALSASLTSATSESKLEQVFAAQSREVPDLLRSSADTPRSPYGSVRGCVCLNRCDPSHVAVRGTHQKNR